MTLHAGARLGVFEVLSPLGKGGMGEVYRARDTRLGRDVAIKVLPDELARDSERLRRFEREAKALAALKHPNIATLHGFERDGDVGFLVMELIEGETLADWIARGPIPWREAAALFEAIADALKAAHESGIVHRDVKPANIKIDDQGHPKILDFGLAAMDVAAVGDTAAPVAVTHSPTLAVPTTMMGVLLGTAPYMAPEQARGLRVDRRADVWGFGCCLYEALTGTRPFEGEEVSLVLAAVLASEPDWSRLPVDAPRELSMLVRRCLDKNPRRRLQDLGDARWSLAEAREASSDTVVPTGAQPAGGSARTWSAGAAVAVAALLVGGGIGWWVHSGSADAALDAQSEPVVARFQVSTPFAIASTLQGRQVAVHPNGAAFAFASTAGGEGSIYLHDLREGSTRPISGTERGEQPFFSRDGHWLGFVRESALFKMPAGGGLPQRLCTLPLGLLAGIDFRDDRIVFAMWSGSGRGLWELPATGGEAKRLGEMSPLATGSSPTFLAEREAILFSGRGGDDADHIIQRLSVLDLASGSVRDLGLEGAAPQYLDSGHLIWEGDDGLLAAEFDLDSQRIVGEPRPLLHLESTSRLSALFAASPNGTLVSAHPERFDLVEIAIDGTRRVLAAQPGQVRYARYSPDGRLVAYSRGGIGSGQIWIHEVATGRESPIDDSPNHHVFPVWTPDGRVVYFEVAGSRFSLRLADPERRRDPVTLLETDQSTIPATVSAGGILLYETGPTELWRIDLARPGSAEAWLREPANNASFSPDGRWVAYDSNRSGARQVYVRRYPGPGGARPVSVGGGGQPAWRADGRKLYFVSERGLEEIDVELADDDLRLGAARLVFGLEAPWAEIRDPAQRPYGTRAYDPRPDGRAFIAAQRREDPSRFDVVIGLGRDLRDRPKGKEASSLD